MTIMKRKRAEALLEALLRTERKTPQQELQIFILQHLDEFEAQMDEGLFFGQTVIRNLARGTARPTMATVESVAAALGYEVHLNFVPSQIIEEPSAKQGVDPAPTTSGEE